MKAHILRGSKQEIVEGLGRISGDVREAIVFEVDTASSPSIARAPNGEDIFAEMLPYMVDVANIDDSREAIYSRMENE
jgi:hypothetical protein